MCTAHAQNVAQVFNTSYDPAQGTEAALQLLEMNKFADDLMLQVLVLIEGKEIIREQGDQSNPRAVYLVIKQKASNSTASHTLARSIMAMVSKIQWDDGNRVSPSSQHSTSPEKFLSV